jgi:hypothetical protein
VSDAPAEASATDGGLAPVIVGLKELDPIADVEAKVTKNGSKVGSVRPSALLYTSGIGATVDLPHLSVMPHGLDAWQRYYDRRAGGRCRAPPPRPRPRPPWRPGDPAPQGTLGTRDPRRIR